MFGAKFLRISFDEIDGFVKVYDGTRYLVLFGHEKQDFIYNRIRYLIGVKTCITYVISHYIMMELMFLKELMLIRQGNQKSAILVIIGIF